MTFVPTKSPINADPVLRRYVEREFHAIARSMRVSTATAPLAIDVREYGAVADDSTDNTAAFNNAIAACVGRGQSLYIPGGIYRAAGPCGIDGTALGGALTIYGDGMLRTFIRKTSGTGDLFDIQAGDSVVVRDLNVTAAVTQTAGAYFRFRGPSAGGPNVFSRVDNCRIGSGYEGLNFEEAAGFVVSRCYLVTNTYGIVVQNTAGQDNGDSGIEQCVFDTSVTAGTVYGIYQLGSGGLRLIGNKFLNHHYGYFGSFGAGVATSILMLSGNSFEDQETSCVHIETSGGGAFGKVVIVGNQFTASPTDDYAIAMFGVDNSVIQGNEIQVGANLTAGVHIEDCEKFIVGGNNIWGSSGTGIGVRVTSGSSHGTVGFNNYRTLATDVDNSSGTTTVH